MIFFIVNSVFLIQLYIFSVLGASSTYTDDCSAGYHCISGSWVPNPTDGVKGMLCPVGKYCPAGTETPVDCPAGTFNNRTGLEKDSDCTPCTPGKYCEGGGLRRPTGDCDEKYYCTLGAKYAKPLLPSTGGNCTKGHYCPAGSKDPIPCPVS